MTRAELLTKIKKCLALAKSANEHEAAAALDKARKLMDEYGVDQIEVDLADVGEGHARASRCQRPPLWEAMLAQSVKRAIPCELLIDGNGNRTFVGIGAAPEVAAYAFTVLFRQLQAARKHYIATTLRRCTLARKRKRADVFCEGWASAVYRQIARLNPEQPTDPLIRQYLAQRYAGLDTVGSRAAGLSGRVAEDDRARGYDSGHTAELNHGVAGRAAPLRIGQR